MRLKYDASANALYIELLPRSGKIARTAEIDDGTNADLDADGNLLGIEVLNPGRPWPLAEILRRYEVSGEDAAMLIAACPFRCSVKVA